MNADPRDWAIFVHHHEALRLNMALAALTVRIDKDHGPKEMLLATAAAQQILNEKVQP